MGELPVLVDIDASIASAGRQTAEGARKTTEDLDRYRQVIAATRPEVIVECGSGRGASGVWFADQGPAVVSVDVRNRVRSRWREKAAGRVWWLVGSTTDPMIVARVQKLVGDNRCMVVLDSDHSAAHVAAEILLYGPLVTPGCHLVVEDGIIRWLTIPKFVGSPLDAIEQHLPGNPDWQRDEAIETLHPATMYVAGWWRRR